MRCRRESAVAQRGNVSEEAGTTTHKRAPIALRRGENRLPAGLLIQPKEGTREKPAAFARKQRANSPKRPTFARELRDFLPPTLRRTTKQRKHRTSTAGVCSRMRAACAVAAVCDEPLRRSAFAQRDFGLPQGTGSTTKRPSPLESRKGRSGTALHGWQLTLRQRGPGRDQDLRSNSWRFSRRLVSRNS